ncbi:hypothetical protein [Halorientalis sp. IM1011]|mgnify:FL=1|uniref:DUF7556 family protein n=1 Tax=Halorientalis sp. IM1011 TaxID=1932360 RepID=UPI001561432F|nr:hypothetical protein [Halorientalis sp. IM1011]
MQDSTNEVGQRDREPGTVVAAIDQFDEESHVVIADTTQDDRWLAMPTSNTAVLDEWR